MGSTADLTTGQKTIIDTLHRKPQKFMAKEAGCPQSAVSKHINGKSSGRAKSGRRRCTSTRDDRGLQQIIKQTRFKNFKSHHIQMHPGDGLQYNCRVPRVKPLLSLIDLGIEVQGFGGSWVRKRTQAAWGQVWNIQNQSWFGVLCPVQVQVGKFCFLTAKVYQNVWRTLWFLLLRICIRDADFILQQDLAPAHTSRSTKT